MGASAPLFQFNPINMSGSGGFQYYGTLPTETSDTDAAAAVDSQHRQIVVVAGESAPVVEDDGYTLFSDFGASNAASVKGSAGNVFSITCYNENAAIHYFQLHNKATAPIATEVPIFSIPVPPSGGVILDESFFSDRGTYFATGIGFAWSSTDATATLGTAGEQTTHIRYV